MKSILFYFGHPAQFLFAKNTINKLQGKGHNVLIFIRSKDILEELIVSSGLNFQNILSDGRKDTTSGIILGVIKRGIRLYHLVKNNKVDIMVGTDPTLAHVGKLFGVPVITTLEDDADIIPKLARITFPFTTHIFTPNVCKVGKKYESKKLAYEGYMKLAYLHPVYFKPDHTKVQSCESPYILIRLAKLTAHHDDDITGIDLSFIDDLLEVVKGNYKIYINSEYELSGRYEQYRLKTNPSDIHHILFYSSLFISDSQSMTVEAAVLGTPSIRYSSFAGRISVLEELEKKYLLTHSITPPAKEELLETAKSMLYQNDIKALYQSRRKKMLSEKIDVTELLTDLIDRYPLSLARFRD
ncbi:MAG: DUF354 domain-containing protein [Balneolales bacterium]